MTIDFPELTDVVNDFSGPIDIRRYPATTIVNNRRVPGGAPVAVLGSTGCVYPVVDTAQTTSEGVRLTGKVEIYSTNILIVKNDRPGGNRGDLVVYKTQFYEIIEQKDWDEFRVYVAELKRQPEGF